MGEVKNAKAGEPIRVVVRRGETALEERLGPEKTQVLKASYSKCDKNEDGRISREELKKACQEDADIAKLFGGPAGCMEDVFSAMDENADKEVAWGEFLSYVAVRHA